MLKKLKKLLRGALLAILAEEDKEVKPASIECWVGGQVRRMAIRGTRGLMLVAYDGQTEMMVREGDAVSSDDFWRAWDAWNQSKVEWEDGTPFREKGK